MPRRSPFIPRRGGSADGFAGVAVPAGDVGKVALDTVKVDVNPGAGGVAGGLGMGGAP